MKQTLSTLKVIVLALVLGLGISYAQAVWTGPTAAPTGGNVAAPLNVGATAQIKTGDLKVNNLEMSGATATSGTTLTTSGSTWAYGALDIKGSKGGYSGINFKNSDGTNAGALVMKSDGYAGFFNTSLVNNWSFIVYPNIAASPGAVRIPGLAASPAALGKVLTAVNVAGDATWQTPATAASGAPTFITPVIIANVSVINNVWTGASNGVWTTYNAASIIPVGAKVVILEYYYYITGNNTLFTVKIRKNSSSPAYLAEKVALENCGMGCDGTYSDQRFFPISDTRTFDYYITGNQFSGFQISIIGYM